MVPITNKLFVHYKRKYNHSWRSLKQTTIATWWNDEQTLALGETSQEYVSICRFLKKNILKKIKLIFLQRNRQVKHSSTIWMIIFLQSHYQVKLLINYIQRLIGLLSLGNNCLYEREIYKCVMHLFFPSPWFCPILDVPGKIFNEQSKHKMMLYFFSFTRIFFYWGFFSSKVLMRHILDGHPRGNLMNS
jgi:hypothetical protein